MAKKESKVSINTVDKYLKVCAAEPATITMVFGDGEAMEVKVKKTLSWNEMTQMVYDAVNAVFFEEDGDEIYHPEFEEIAKANAILTYVANFKNEMSMSRIHELMYVNGFMNAVIDQWSSAQHNDFLAQFRRMVDHKVAIILASERSKLMKISDKLDQASEAMKIVTDAFGGISAEQMQTVINTMSNMDALSLANAVVDARDKDFVDQRRAQLEVVK